MNKPHVEHAVPFVQDEHFYIVEAQVPPAGEIEQASRCRNNDFRFPGEGFQLLDHRYATQNDSAAKRQVSPVGP